MQTAESTGLSVHQRVPLKDIVEEALERDRTPQAVDTVGDVESFGTSIVLCLGDETPRWWLDDPLRPIDPAFDAADYGDDHLLTHNLVDGAAETLERKVAQADLCLFAGYHGPRNCGVLEMECDSLPTIAFYRESPPGPSADRLGETTNLTTPLSVPFSQEVSAPTGVNDPTRETRLLPAIIEGVYRKTGRVPRGLIPRYFTR